MAPGATSLQLDVDDRLFAEMLAVTREAGRLTMAHFREGSRIAGRIDWKAGNSPVTEADFAVDLLLREKLRPLLPQAGWLSEETADTPDRLTKDAVFVVDPIDGTRGFMEGDPRFAVSVALVVAGRPVAAIIDAPALDQVFTARVGRGAELNGTAIQVTGSGELVGARIAGPKFLTEPVALKLGMVAQPKVPSLALRFAQTAAGQFDAAVASRDAHDWDIAAADLILHEAGASLRDLDGAELAYNREEPRHGILIASADPFQTPVREALLEVTATWRERGRAANKS